MLCAMRIYAGRGAALVLKSETGLVLASRHAGFSLSRKKHFGWLQTANLSWLLGALASANQMESTDDPQVALASPCRVALVLAPSLASPNQEAHMHTAAKWSGVRSARLGQLAITLRQLT
jgi:hypothetical protein